MFLHASGGFEKGTMDGDGAIEREQAGFRPSNEQVRGQDLVDQRRHEQCQSGHQAGRCHNIERRKIIELQLVP